MVQTLDMVQILEGGGVENDDFPPHPLNCQKGDASDPARFMPTAKLAICNWLLIAFVTIRSWLSVATSGY